MKRTLLALALSVLLGAISHAQTINWNAGSGSWTDAGNWLPLDVPDQAGDHAVFASPSANSADATLAGPIAIGTLTMSASAPKLTIQNFGQLTTSATNISSLGAQLIVQSGGRFTSGEFNTNSAINVNGGGTLTATHYQQTIAGESVIAGTLDASSGSIEVSEGRLTTSGMIRANALHVSDLSELVVQSGGSVQTSTFENNGLLRLNGGAVSSTSAIAFNNNASVIGSGTLGSATINDSGIVSPGSRNGPTISTGDLHVAGDLTFQSTSTTLQIDITDSGFDTVHVDGTANLATFLTVPVAGSFKPAVGSEYVILSAGSIDMSGIDYDHVLVNNEDRISVSNDDDVIGSFKLVDRLVGMDGQELVLSDFESVPETGLSLLFIGCAMVIGRPPRRRLPQLSWGSQG